MSEGRLVYSTGVGRIRPPDAARPDAAGRGPRRAPAPSGRLPQDGVLRVFRERAGRGGKVVTVIRGVPRAVLDARAAELRRLCGTGGTVKDGAVELQGDHRERVLAHLRGLGHTVKLAGG
jgi:translation initiation factor 1